MSNYDTLGLTSSGKLTTYQELKDQLYPAGTLERKKLDKQLKWSLYNAAKSRRRRLTLSLKSQLNRYGFAL